MTLSRVLMAATPLILVACAPAAQSDPDLFDRLSAYCGQAFEGEVTSEDERDADFASERLVMHVRECGESRAARAVSCGRGPVTHLGDHTPA